MENFIFTVIGYVFWISVLIGLILIYVMFIKGIIDIFRGKDIISNDIKRGEYPDEIYDAFH